MSVDIVTFGCRLNGFESEQMRDRAAEAGLEDAIVFNTCAVTGEAVRQARQAIRRARRERPDAPILVTGCAAQVDSETFAAMPEVTRVLGQAEKLDAGSYAPWELRGVGVGDTERVRVNDVFELKEIAPHLVTGLGERARAHVQVQNGCDHRCTFCIIPYGRGNSRSVPMGAVVDQVRLLVEHGYKEVVLTGVDMTSYGADLPGTPRLGVLVRAILRHVPDLARLRISSIDSIEADGDLMRALEEEERLMPHLHLSLQAGDDLTLKRMKRRHSRADATRFCDEARRLRPDIAFGADLIAGFPTETEAMFENTLSLVEECGLAYVHAFPFSPRPGTPAARMPQVDRRVVKDRAARLREAGRRAQACHLESEVGARRRALVERDAGPGRQAVARTERFSLTELETGKAGDLIDVRVSGVRGDRLTAQPLMETV